MVQDASHMKSPGSLMCRGSTKCQLFTLLFTSYGIGNIQQGFPHPGDEAEGTGTVLRKEGGAEEAFLAQDH